MYGKKQSKREKMRRLLSLILAIVMALSFFGTIIYYLAVSVSASKYKGYDVEDFMAALDKKENGGKSSDEDDEDETEDEEDFDEEDEDEAVTRPSKGNSNSDNDKLIRVALMYGSNVTVGFEVDTDFGFQVNAVDRLGDLTNEPLWELDITKISCTVDANLSKSAMTYSKTTSQKSTVIGGYHARIGVDLSRRELERLIDEVEDTLDNLDVYPIPAYIEGGYTLLAGHFPSLDEAEELAELIKDEHPDLRVYTLSPTNTAVSVVDPLTDTILFEYDDSDETALGLTPLDSPDGEISYLVTPAKKIYDGTFMFRRYISGATDGVSLTGIIPLGEYIKGVLPYEISSSWPIEAKKAFAICVRSFTLASVRHEKAYQADLCNTAHCQVYGGRKLITESVERAVEETDGLVMTSGGKIVTAYYSAVTGGVTVGVDDAWGGPAQSYLVAVDTPWELFTTHSEGAWQVEISPKELCEYLSTTKGYTQLRGKISSITIDSLAKNSTYVYQITFTDSHGTSVTVKTTDAVRTALAKYVNSANFVVGKGSVEAEQTAFITSSKDDINVITKRGVMSAEGITRVYVESADDTDRVKTEDCTVLTANGKISLTGNTAVTEKVTVYAEDPDNFIFVGKGWGHGVGISQWGVLNLANLGYGAEAILSKYFTGIDIVDFREIIG